MFGKGRGKKGKVPEARPSSWAIQGGAAEKIINTPTLPPNKKAKKGEAKGEAKGEEPKLANELVKNQATEEQIEAICEVLRSNKVEKALQFVQKEPGGSFWVTKAVPCQFDGVAVSNRSLAT